VILCFDHVGVVTTEKQPDEIWVEPSRVWVTNPRKHPNFIEFLRFEQDSQVPQIAKDSVHVAYKVDKLEDHLAEGEIIIEPFQVADMAKVVFLLKEGLLVEYMEYINDGSWFGEA
jgi:hypothetical protein